MPPMPPNTTHHDTGDVVGFQTGTEWFDVPPTLTDNDDFLPKGNDRLCPLHCTAQNYAWGRIGSNSIVARMKAAQAAQENDAHFSIDESKPYAELWLGTHANGMSHVLHHDEEKNRRRRSSLVEHIQQDPELHCGDQSEDLAFLLKVLSIEKVLSIQAHPDKELAERLHAEQPTVYKDDNHKPEMAIALSQVKAMCGFRPMHEIEKHLEIYPEFLAVVGDKAAKAFLQRQDVDNRCVLQALFRSFLDCPQQVLQEQLSLLVNRLHGQKECSEVEDSVLCLSHEFPNDSGIMAPLLLNVVALDKGEALFIAANEPHAYVSGELVECMACSDNVVRAGLTPKRKDVPTLVDMLTYRCQRPRIDRGIRVDAMVRRYEPPVPDFCVETISVPPFATHDLVAVNGPSLVLTLEGSGTFQKEQSVSFGSAFFCSANTTITISAGPDGIHLTRAFSNLS